MSANSSRLCYIFHIAFGVWFIKWLKVVRYYIIYINAYSLVNLGVRHDAFKLTDFPSIPQASRDNEFLVGTPHRIYIVIVSCVLTTFTSCNDFFYI